MSIRALSLRIVGPLLLIISAAASAVATNSQETSALEEPRTVALESWQAHLQTIGWTQDMSERMAPQFLGAQKSSVANEFGGVTVTFDGSRPGLLSTVTVVMGANGRPVAKPVVELGDVLEVQ
jgi:hypothetical protein